MMVTAKDFHTLNTAFCFIFSCFHLLKENYSKSIYRLWDLLTQIRYEPRSQPLIIRSCREETLAGTGQESPGFRGIKNFFAVGVVQTRVVAFAKL